MNNPYKEKELETRTLNPYQNEIFHIHKHLLLSIPSAPSSLWQPEMKTARQKSSVFKKGGAVVLLSLLGKTILVSGGNLSNSLCFLPEIKSLMNYCYCYYIYINIQCNLNFTS